MAAKSIVLGRPSQEGLGPASLKELMSFRFNEKFLLKIQVGSD